ncbi:ABC transporter permease [Salibacterium halotolerans]|uniref:ABC-2 type transport system permease protein n=1 Tax=Salibacterium halotolerans TaxID=1884432 RepID=A0A1I5WTH4_9BACI|nr:ABC transporter permease [Salibacterium halotolerans]SFQ22931.1 ABC-2 type transport system permease protein [Salibacterium halotolerans]
MSLLVKNECMKLKRQKMVYVILVISFIPYLINTGGMLATGAMDPGNYYFFIFNQYAILFPALVFIFSGFFFYTEFQNGTTLNWISYPFHNFRLMFSKMAATFLLLMATSLINHLVHLFTLWILFRSETGVMDVLSRFLPSILFTVLTLLVIPIAALLAFATKNILSVVTAGLGSIFITTILLGADVSIVFPFSFIYRVAIQFYDAAMGYEGVELVLWGGLLFFIYISFSLFGLYKYSQKARMS